jgi:preprotein translocase subunit SecG
MSILVFSNVYLVIKNIIRSIIIIVIVLYQKKKKINKKNIGSFLNFTKVQNADKKLKINIPVSN